MWAREKNLEPPSAWNCCTQTCSADGLGSTSIQSLSFLYRTDGETPLARKKGYQNHWIFLLALCIDLGCWEEVENGVWDQEGGKSRYLLSNTPDGFSSLDFWIRTCLASTAGVLLSLRQGIVAAKTGQCSLLPWFPWMLDIARYCCWGQSILIWQSKRKAVT